MNKSFLRILVVFLAIPFFFVSCKQEYTDLGSEFIDVNTNVTLLDTFTVKLSTIQLDSVPTSGTKTILVGTCNDPEFGNITALSYFQLATCGSQSLDKNTAIYDSICLYLKYNKYIYGDTNVNQTINVYKLDKNIAFYSDNYIYNTTKFDYNTKIGDTLGVIHYKPMPTYRTSLGIKLSDTLGEDLFKKVLNKEEIISDNNRFIDYFKGIVVVPNINENAAIIGFKDSSYIQLYYHTKGDKQQKLKFLLYNSDKGYYQYNQILYNRSGTDDLKEFVKDTTISSNSTGHAAFSQAGTGLITKIEFPYIKNLLLSGKYYSILKAELIVEPVASSYSRTFPLPSRMYLSEPTANSVLGTPIVVPATNFYATGNLVVDWLYKKDTKYTYNITSYIKFLLNEQSIKEGDGLLFYSYNFYNTLERVKIGDRYNKDNKISLRLYFMKYEE